MPSEGVLALHDLRTAYGDFQAFQPQLTALLQQGGLLGDSLPELDMAALLPGGPGWNDVQRSLRHDPEGAFRLLYYGLALRGLEALPAPAQLVAPDSAEAPLITVLIPVYNQWAITLNALRSLVAMANGTRFEVIVADDASTDATQQLGLQPAHPLSRREV